MGNHQSIPKLSFEDVQEYIKYDDTILINTLNMTEQDNIIKKTIDASQEEQIINNYLNNNDYNMKIIVYGSSCNDQKIFDKYTQLKKLGFIHVYLYIGGLWEWILLQDIYGKDEFPTTNYNIDILKYRPSKWNKLRIMNS
jgi:23S rRNA pseudoU1915 N3-methylase RlmH